MLISKKASFADSSDDTLPYFSNDSNNTIDVNYTILDEFFQDLRIMWNLQNDEETKQYHYKILCCLKTMESAEPLLYNQDEVNKDFKTLFSYMPNWISPGFPFPGFPHDVLTVTKLQNLAADNQC